MDAADLRVFEAVARLGNMSKAAVELGTVQSNVTSRVKTLEAELGVALFRRTGRGAELTDAGERLLPYSQQVASLLADARRAVTDDGTPGGILRIGTLETTAALRLSPCIPAFAAAYDNVDLNLRTGTTRELIELVLDGRIDGAFVCGPVDHPKLRSEEIFEEELKLFASANCKSLQSALDADDLKLLVLRAGCSYRLHLETWLARRGVVGTRAMEFGTLEAIMSCVSAGLGITLLPAGLVQSMGRGHIVSAHRLPNKNGIVKTVFVTQACSHPTSALTAFLDMSRPILLQSVAAE